MPVRRIGVILPNMVAIIIMTVTDMDTHAKIADMNADEAALAADPNNAEAMTARLSLDA